MGCYAIQARLWYLFVLANSGVQLLDFSLPPHFHREIGCPLPPDQVRYSIADRRPYICKTNSLGFRSNREFEKLRSCGVRRVAFFGDSFTEGHGLANELRFTDRVESEILETCNFAVGGTGTDQQFLIFEKFCRHIEIDILVIAPTDINIIRNLVDRSLMISRNGVPFGVPKPRFRLNQGELEFIPAILDGDPIQNWKYPLFADWGSAENWLPQYSNPDTGAWGLMKRIIEFWVLSASIHVILLPIPSRYYASGNSSSSAFKKRWQELAAQLDIGLIDVISLFENVPQSLRDKLYLTDGHLSEFAHGLISELIAADLYESGS